LWRTMPDGRIFRKGIGTKLMEKALAYGHSKKRKLAELLVGEKNIQAQKFYERLGFIKDGKWGKIEA